MGGDNENSAELLAQKCDEGEGMGRHFLRKRESGCEAPTSGKNPMAANRILEAEEIFGT